MALAGRKLEKLEQVRAEIIAAEPDAVGRVTLYSCDIRDEAQVRDTVAAVLAAHGGIDGLFNNAGGQFPSPLCDISLKGWEAVVRNNLTGGFLVARECFTQWMEANGGARLDDGAAPVAQIAMAKNIATRTFQFCADRAVQLLGGMGYMRGSRVERLYREVKVMMIGGGAEEIMKDLAAKQLGI
ncbi:protein of unknown function [Cupriavidus taiwanensis]|uniref:Peroxisomal trans-2-enoyl-CoA reductase n=1 Tax=Cupriavidus taiwanensis TaxID=164546 RepID=A0A9Q7XRW5_9BURK|nr:protein of unknown function [Cupriavidus taiwanensis]